MFLITTRNLVLATESPHLMDDEDTSSTAPPSGEGDNSDLILSLVIKLTEDMSEVKDEVSEMKLNQAVLQQDVSYMQEDISALQQTSTVSLTKMAQLEIQVEGNN